MKIERMPLDSLKQKRTLLEWKQAAYRDISSSLIGFKSKFFDIVNRSSYLLSTSSVKAMSAQSSNSAYVTATASSVLHLEIQLRLISGYSDYTVSSKSVRKGYYSI
jgi:flagellar hook-associated protein 2